MRPAGRIAGLVSEADIPPLLVLQRLGGWAVAPARAVTGMSPDTVAAGHPAPQSLVLVTGTATPDRVRYALAALRAAASALDLPVSLRAAPALAARDSLSRAIALPGDEQLLATDGNGEPGGSPDPLGANYPRLLAALWDPEALGSIGVSRATSDRDPLPVPAAWAAPRMASRAAGFAPVHPPPDPQPWLVLALLVFLAERVLAHRRYRREA